MEKVDLPICKAKKINSDKYVCGYLIELEEMFYISSPKNVESDTAEESRSVYLDDNSLYIDKDYFVAIDQTTLEISFNNGKSFIKWSNLEIHTCTDFELKYQDMKMRAKKEVQPANGSIFTVITDKGR